MSTIIERLVPRPDPALAEFHLRFNAGSPVSEVVLSKRGLLGHVLIRGEDYSGRTKAVSALCGDAALAGFGVIYVTESLIPAYAASLRTRAREAFGPARYHSLYVAIEKGSKLKVSRRAVSVLQFNSTIAPSSVDEVRRRMPGILDWIKTSSFELPLLIALENFHLYANDYVVELLDRATLCNCAVILTTLGSDPRSTPPAFPLQVYEKCATVLDLNRRRPGDA